jgi:hypothetical protein
MEVTGAATLRSPNRLDPATPNSLPGTVHALGTHPKRSES